MVGAERAACDDARLQILDVAVFKMLGCFTAAITSPAMMDRALTMACAT